MQLVLQKAQIRTQTQSAYGQTGSGKNPLPQQSESLEGHPEQEKGHIVHAAVVDAAAGNHQQRVRKNIQIAERRVQEHLPADQRKVRKHKKSTEKPISEAV